MRLEDFKRVGIAKPAGLIGGHGINDAFSQSLIDIFLERVEHLTQRIKIELLGQSIKSTGHQVVFIISQ